MSTLVYVYTLIVYLPGSSPCGARVIFDVSSGFYSVTPWQLHDRKSRCLRGRRHSSILYNPSGFFSSYLVYKWSKFLALQKYGSVGRFTVFEKTSKVNTILKIVKWSNGQKDDAILLTAKVARIQEWLSKQSYVQRNI
jgi:hypothetical protein